ncbi:SAM-dependent RNA methyltransferase [Armillaria luteobubalina]|uniref:SAM-dependent RNA methyltransferase n=1 Tax=Armillaria luteobubalina TaxID=153913 RepID=A0AA39QB07_9AGAR|nr:SAM-dependent RNA methyltransferase [Armillaria luteobubalina]
MGFIYVIEHMEDDDETTRVIPPWATLEYAHMRMLAGSNSQVHFTHVSKSSADALSSSFTDDNDILATASCFQSGVTDRIKDTLPIGKVCLLDPKAEKELSPEDGDGRFEWFLFGGILGDDPPRDRTAELRVLGFPARRLGPIQMTTDTALGVTKLVVEDKIPIDKISYIDYPTIVFNTKESVEMPFRYIAEDSEPKLPPGMRQLLHEDLNKSFDF